MDWPGSGWENLIAFVNTVINTFFPKSGEFVFTTIFVKVSFLSTLLYITQSINKYIYRSCMSGPSNITLL